MSRDCEQFTISGAYWSTRGHHCKLVKKFAKTRLRQSFFTSRIIYFWNGLPPGIIDSYSLIEFKHNVDRYFLEGGKVFDTIDDMLTSDG